MFLFHSSFCLGILCLAYSWKFSASKSQVKYNNWNYPLGISYIVWITLFLSFISLHFSNPKFKHSMLLLLLLLIKCVCHPIPMSGWCYNIASIQCCLQYIFKVMPLLLTDLFQFYNLFVNNIYWAHQVDTTTLNAMVLQNKPCTSHLPIFDLSCSCPIFSVQYWVSFCTACSQRHVHRIMKNNICSTWKRIDGSKQESLNSFIVGFLY